MPFQNTNVSIHTYTLLTTLKHTGFLTKSPQNVWWCPIQPQFDSLYCYFLSVKICTRSMHASVVVLESGLETFFEGLGLGLGLGQQGLDSDLDSGQSGLGILTESTPSPSKKGFFLT